jgi:phosphatidylserine/phosphatidylglycerophosphate/cardiolipin synthase-like enzyme
VTAAAGLATPAAVVAAIRGGRSIELSAYMLEPHGAVATALGEAAERGASVSVTLERAERLPSEALRRLAGRTADVLRERGVAVRFGVAGGDSVHLKAAVVDGTAFLDDRNWAASGETIVATSEPAQVEAVRASFEGRASECAGLATGKGAALELEAAALREGRGDRVDLASESFGTCAVSRQLRLRAERGDHVRLIVNGRLARAHRAGRERATLHRLAAAGVEIRTSGADEKLCVAGDRGWVGSANATFEVTPMTDWGLAVRDSGMLDALADTFEREWAAARPFR